ncbi:S49 family peptidase [Vibrio alginolyticus]|uniref:S49 family peptidase n=1 Tax=Vibrio alginolyticus TaxID=663 RepID=UPI003D7C9F5F
MNYLSKAVLQKPQLCSLSFFETIAEVIENKEARQLALSGEALSSPNPLKEKLEQQGVGVLDVSGVLTAKPTPFQALCGGTNYSDLITNMQKLADSGKKKVVLNISSGGGEAFNCFYCAKQLRKIADTNGIKLTAWIDGESCSAAYALASSAHNIIADPESYSIGSVGVVIKLQNDSKALEQQGISRSFVYVGSKKIPYAADGSFKQEFLDDLQESVNTTYQKFVEHVANYRPLSKQQIIDTQAAVYSADKALSLKLVDKLLTQEEFLTYMQGNSVYSPKPTPAAKATNTPAFDKAKATALASVSKPVVKSEPEQELSYEQEKLEHKLKLEAAVRRAKEKRGL